MEVQELSAKVNWSAFQKHVRTITGLSPQETMQLCSHLKAQRDMWTWSETEITNMKDMKELWVKVKEKKDEVEKIKKEKVKKEKVEKVEKVEEVKKEKVEVKVKKEKIKKVIDEDPVMPETAPTIPTPPTVPTASTPPTVTEPVKESIASLEFHLAEAKKKVAGAMSVAEKEAAAAEKALKSADDFKKKADDAQKMADDLKKRAEDAQKTADDLKKRVEEASNLVDTCQQEVVVRTSELEKAVTVETEPEPEQGSEPIHVRRKKIPKHIKTLVWNKYIGPDNASADCVSCRTMKISNRSFHCGHVIAESKGGDMTINNLRPICDACNGSMGTRSMNEFTKEFFGWTV